MLLYRHILPTIHNGKATSLYTFSVFSMWFTVKPKQKCAILVLNQLQFWCMDYFFVAVLFCAVALPEWGLYVSSTNTRRLLNDFHWMGTKLSLERVLVKLSHGPLYQHAGSPPLNPPSPSSLAIPLPPLLTFYQLPPPFLSSCHILPPPPPSLWSSSTKRGWING